MGKLNFAIFVIGCHVLSANFSKTAYQKLNLKLYSDRAEFALSEYDFIFHFSCIVFEKFGLEHMELEDDNARKTK